MRVFNILLTVIVLLWITCTVLLHQIEGVDLLTWYILGTPLVIVRLVKAYLEVALWVNKNK